MTNTKIQNKCIALAKTLEAKFTMNGNPLEYNQVFSAAGLLPALSKRADQLAALCTGYGIGASFEDEENSMLGVKVIFDDITPDMARFPYLAHVLIELINAAPSPASGVPLDELNYD